MCLQRWALALLILPQFFAAFASNASAQIAQGSLTDFDSRMVFSDIDVETASGEIILQPVWWQKHVTVPYSKLETLPTDIHTAMFLAIQHSHRIQIAKQDPLIRQTAIQEACANFDWVKYLDSVWNDSSEPIGNNLTAGGSTNRFNDHTAQFGGGFRRTNEYGGQLDIGQRFGWQDNNSQFLSPRDQATGRLTLSYTHPLRRGGGRFYNTSIVFLARLDADAASHEFLAAFQDELFDITEAYWQLYLERSYLAQQISLYLKTKKIYEFLAARQNVDVQPTQMVAARSALATRRAELIRARTAVTNAETQLRGLINSPALSTSDKLELLPSESPTLQHFPVTNAGQIQTALQTRPELAAAIRQVKAGCRRLGIARHEMMPALNLVTQASAAGLRGNNNFGNAFGDQFTGTPSYSIGLQYEIPVGNRAARARVCRQQFEVVRLRSEYARAVEAVKTEVDIAVREVNTTYQEISAKSQALAAAEAEANTIQQRWLRMVDGPGTASLNLESLLRAQERVLEAERQYASSIIAYNLSLLRLKRSNGTLLQSENVSMTFENQCGCNSMNLHKGRPVTYTTPEESPVLNGPFQPIPLERDFGPDGSNSPLPSDNSVLPQLEPPKIPKQSSFKRYRLEEPAAKPKSKSRFPTLPDWAVPNLKFSRAGSPTKSAN